MRCLSRCVPSLALALLAALRPPAAAGASYGGYLVDWIAGQTARLRALVTHDGVFDLVSMYGATEKLCFPEWELTPANSVRGYAEVIGWLDHWTRK